MIRYLKQEEIDLKKWNNCIAKSLNSYIYAYSWYLDIVASEWDALVEDDYIQVFPLPFRKKMGVKYIYQPVFTQVLGLFSIKLNGNSKLQDFFDAIPKEFKLIEIKLNKFNTPKSNPSVRLKKNVNIELDLIADYEDIYTKYSKNLKRNIKKAKKHKLQVIEGVKPEYLIQLFKDHKGQEVRAYTDLDYIRLGRLIYLLIHKGMAKIYGVSSSENNLIAAALFVRDRHRYIFLFSGLSVEGKQKGAMPLLIDSFIQNKSGSPMVLDFEGSNNLNLARFYRSFGASDYHYYDIRMIRGSGVFRTLLGIKKALS